MDMNGETLVPASRQRVWDALNDPEILKACIPGCDEIEKHSDTEMSAKVTAKVGPVKAKFTGQVTLSELDPPNGYRIDGEGKGGPAGFAKGGATVSLSDGDGGTLLTYAVHASVGGKLAQIGSRLIDSTARKMADEFFGKFAELVGDNSQEDASVTETEEKLEETDMASSSRPAGVPEENVYDKVHWAILMSYGIAVLTVIAFFTGLGAE